MARRVNILIIDDDGAIRDLMLRVLRSDEYQTHAVDSGQAALELSKETKFDIAFIDMQMPGMDGVETYHKLKELNPAITAVIVTGYADDEKIKLALGAGAVACIRKPFDMLDIRSIVEDRLQSTYGDTMRILAVDDDPVICHFFKKIEALGGYRVFIASDGDEAVELVNHNRFDAAFIDVVIPGVNGLEVCEHICSVSKATQIVLFTGMTDRVKVMMDIAGKFDLKTMEKPFTLEQVQGFLADIKQGQGVSAE